MNQTNRIVRSIDLDHAVVALRDDDIIHIYFKQATEINPKLQDEVLNACRELAEPGKAYPYVYEAGDFLTMSKDARKHAVEIEQNHPSNVFAMVVQNLAQKILANHYYKDESPKRPYQINVKFEDAIDWLAQNRNLRML